VSHWAILLNVVGNPPDSIRTDAADRLPLLGCKRLKKLGQNLFAIADSTPDHRSRIVIDYYGHVLVVLLIAGFIYTDVDRAIKVGRILFLQFFVYLLADSANGVPLHPQKLCDNTLRHLGPALKNIKVAASS